VLVSPLAPSENCQAHISELLLLLLLLLLLVPPNTQAEMTESLLLLETTLAESIPDKESRLMVSAGVYPAYDLAWQMEELLMETPDLDKLASCIALQRVSGGGGGGTHCVCVGGGGGVSACKLVGVWVGIVSRGISCLSPQQRLWR
jgi:hypothetical protein